MTLYKLISIYILVDYFLTILFDNQDTLINDEMSAELFDILLLNTIPFALLELMTLNWIFHLCPRFVSRC